MSKRPRYGTYHLGRFAHPADVQLIDGPFATHMREHGYAHNCVAQYRYHLMRVAGWLASQRHRRLTSLTRSEVSHVVQQLVGDGSHSTYAGVINRWLRFRQCYTVETKEPWSRWLGDFAAFLKDHRGFKRLTAEGYVAFARRFLSWQFGDREALWSDVRPQDIWRYAELCAEGHASSYAKSRLGALR